MQNGHPEILLWDARLLWGLIVKLKLRRLRYFQWDP